MASFFKSLVGKFKGGADPRLYLAAFGKHPGWNDHIDDLGFETDHLVAVKRLLYVQGIGANIDAASWENLPEDQRLEGFNHAFLWYNPDHMILGRFWSSRDGKGRDKYPMVVAAETTGMALGWLVRNVFGQLEKTEQRCLAATTAPQVVAAVDAERAALRRLAASAPAESDTQLSPRQLLSLADNPDFAPQREGFHRILYQVQRGLAPYRPGGNLAACRPEHLRVPRGQQSPVDAAALYLRLLLAQLDPATSILILIPLDQPFLDILVGEPTPAQFFCVRAAPRAVPLISDIPYTIDAPFAAAVESFITACAAAGENPLPPFPTL